MKTKSEHKKSSEKDNSHRERGPKNKLLHVLRPIFWFFIGVFFAGFCLSAFFLIYFRIAFKDHVIPGVFVGNEYVGGKTIREVKKIYDNKNKIIGQIPITFTVNNYSATVSAQDLGIGYDSNLISKQAESIGKSPDMMSNTYYIINSYMNGTYLSPAYTSSPDNLAKLLAPLEKQIHIDPVNAVFQIQNKKVTAFKESVNGKTLDYDALQQALQNHLNDLIEGKVKSLSLKVPEKVLYPDIPTEKANNLGIVEEIGVGTSLFYHSAPERIHNIVLAASKINGVLVAPGEEFSFDKNLGDVSAYAGYQQAYIIENGRTVLGDGGGVCQVSTTLFRAILNGGLPITARTAHDYRVGYYEEDSPPGLDATVYYPTVDLKFKNDTGNYILILAHTDLDNLSLTFTLYGKKDGRTVSMTTPVVTNQIPAPPPLYQDDPTLPAGDIKQVDFAAAGATVTFTRTVTKNGKPYIQDTYKSVYHPWQAVFLRGTKTS